MGSPCKPTTWPVIPLEIGSSIACCCSSNIHVLLRLLCLIKLCIPWYIATQCIASCILSRNALKSLIIASEHFPSRQFWGPMNLRFAYDCVLRGVGGSALERRTVQAAGLLTRWLVRIWSLDSLISNQKTRRWKVITCGRLLRLWLEEFHQFLRIVRCAWSSLSAEYCWKALYRQNCLTQCDIKWNFGKWKSVANSLETYILWLIYSYLAITLHRFLHGIQVWTIVSSSTFRIFTSSIIRILAFALAILLARPGKSTSLKVAKRCKASSM